MIGISEFDRVCGINGYGLILAIAMGLPTGMLFVRGGPASKQGVLGTAALYQKTNEEFILLDTLLFND